MSIALTSASRGLRRDSRRISRSIDRDFEERRRLRRDRSRCSSLLRLEFLQGSSALYGHATTWQVQPRRPVGPFFPPCPRLAPVVSSSFFAGVHRFSSRAPGRPFEQLTAGQPWPTDCARNPSVHRGTYRTGVRILLDKAVFFFLVKGIQWLLKNQSDNGE